MDSRQYPRQGRQNRLHIGFAPDGADPGRDLRPLQIMADLIAHDPGLFANLVGKGALMVVRLVGNNRKRRLQGMSQIANLRAGAVNNVLIG